MESLLQSAYGILVSVLRLGVWLIVLSAIFVPLERLFAVQPHRIFRKEFVTDLGYYFLSSLVPSILLGFPTALVAWTAHHITPAALLTTTGSLPLGVRLLLGLVVGEFGYYWAHRLMHEIPFLWRFHAVHHSAEEVDFLTNTRAHPFDMVFGRFCGIVPMYLLGLAGPTNASGTVVPVLIALFGTVWGFFIHANLRWRFGPLEWLISTPLFHHWHHTRTGPINHNYSSTFPWIDWLFGTLHLPRRAWPESYGIRSWMPDTLAEQLIYPLFPPIAASTNAGTEPGAPAVAVVPASEPVGSGNPG